MTTKLLSPAGNRVVAIALLYVVLLVPPVPIEAVAATPADSLDEYRCGPLAPPGQYGPYDYRTATREQKYLVETAHFSNQTEMLIRGTSGPRVAPDIDYTLRVFPNHPRALKSMMELRFRDKANPPAGMTYLAECWFNRALRFTPDDPQVRMIYGFFLLRSGEKQAAIAQLEMARDSGASSGNFHYNLGLAYFQAQDYERARIQAYKARELGFELQGLKNLLTRAGQWREKESDSVSPTAPGSAAPDSAATVK